MLDCETSEGRKAIVREDFVKEYFAERENVIIKKPRNKASYDDGLMYRKGHPTKPDGLMGVCEIKSRVHWGRDAKTPFTLDKLMTASYLITESKLYHLRRMSREHNVNSYILLHIPHDKCILSFRVTDRNGEFLIRHKAQRTNTYNTVNDYKGKVNRVNAFIPMQENRRQLKLFKYGS